MKKPLRIIVVMGVTGCGKSSVGAGLSRREGVPFLDGDDFHPTENVEKMSAGTPLTDDDRWPWLDILSRALVDTAAINGRVYAACSALKRVYRERLAKTAGEPVLFIHLNGDRDLIAGRMAARKGHYMPPSLLDSQFYALEMPEADEFALSVSIDGPIDTIIESVARHIEDISVP